MSDITRSCFYCSISLCFLVKFRVGAVLQSNQSLNIDESFMVDVGIMHDAEAGGGGDGSARRKAITNTDTTSEDCSIKKKRSMVFIPDVEDEYLCAGRAIVTCMAKLKNMNKKEYNMIISHRNVHSANPKSQRMRAIRLYLDTGMSMRRAVPVTELSRFEKKLGIQIVVISGDMGNTVIYKGFKVMKDKIFLYLKDQHYHSIVNINGFYVNKKLCQQCLTPYARKVKHSCRFMCKTCGEQVCMFGEDSLACPDCNMVCRNAKCYLLHKEAREYKIGAKKGEERLSLCDTFHRCKKCTKIIDKTKRDFKSHICGEWFCRCCGEYVVNDHLCYYRIKKPKITSGRFLYYDFETCQDTVIQCENGYTCKSLPNCPDCHPNQLCAKCRKCVNCKRSYCGLQRHLPNYLVCQSACDTCQDDPFKHDSLCENCGDRCSKCGTRDKDSFTKPLCTNGLCGMRERVFKGMDTCRDFCQWLITPQHKGMVVIAHNSKAFDNHFILNHCVENGIFPDVTYTGSKIMTMTIGEGVDLRFIDSLNFLPMALKKLPQALNLGQELMKGQFPHFLNTKDNWNLVSATHPAPHLYGADHMSVKDRADFMAWHSGVKTKEFDFQKEILAYTRSDVSILREACVKFRNLIRQITTLEGSAVQGVDPFAHATIASSAMQIIRQLMLYEEHDVELVDGRKGRGVLKRGSWVFEGEPVDTVMIAETKFVKSPIPQIPARGYGRHTNDSNKAIVWLEWVAHKNQRKIKHSRNGGEHRITGTRFSVDGFHEESQKVYEFFGCRFHGHHCMKDRQKIYDPRTNSSLESVYQRTMLRLQQIRSMGYSTVVMWECEFDAMLKSNSELQAFASKCDTVTPLKIRDSFFGGRVSPVKLFYEALEDEKIRYLDVTSLYPFITLSGRYPTNHCDIITNHDDFDYTLESYYGLVKLKVLPPRKLYIPVLPVRCGGKLKFPLCSKCSRTETSRPCKCSDADRAITGTWTTEEVKAAVQAGYKVVKIYEVYHFSETSMDDGCPGNIFEEYVKMFLKVKQEASGYPNWVVSEDDKDRYLENYREKQGISLEKDNVQYNASLRLISKLYANSAWGKFVQRSNMGQTMYVKSCADLAKVRNDPTKSVTNFHIITDEYIVLEFKNADTFEEESTFTNEIIGTFTTTLARLHLLKILQKTGEDTLYFDTDSVIFREKNNHETLHVGDLLGELTDELPRGQYIKTFLSSGPKSYCYKQNDDTCVTKIKGITLNHTNNMIIDFDVMKDIVIGRQQIVKLPVASQISRVKHMGIIYNRPQSKIFRKVFTKRVVIQGTFDTVPYGY